MINHTNRTFLLFKEFDTVLAYYYCPENKNTLKYGKSLFLSYVICNLYLINQHLHHFK